MEKSSSIPLHALLVLTETFSSHLDKFPADCPEFELYWLLSNQSGILLRRDLESDGPLIPSGQLNLTAVLTSTYL